MAGVHIKQIMEIRYIRITEYCYRNMERHVWNQVEAVKVAGYFNIRVWRNKCINTDIKSRIFKTIIRPIMTYAA